MGFNSILKAVKGRNGKMAKKTRDLKPDTVLKDYWRGNEQFADIFNAVLFEGRQVIRPEELEDVDTEESSVMEHREYAESIKASRDNIKVGKKSTAYGVELVMLGLESQEHIHYAMPMRVMGYDYSTYKKQYDSNAKKYRDSGGMEEDEYLSGMKKTDRLMPVITVVVYYGEKPWDGAVSLHGMLDIPEGMEAFVNDYRLLLVEARENSLAFHNVKNVHFFNMLKMILDQSTPKDEAKEKVIGYAKEHKVDKTVLMTVAGAANCKIDYNALSRKGDFDMCTLFDEIAKEGEAKGEAKGRAEGKAEGRAEGEAKGIIETGFDFGLSENDILERLQKKLDLSLQMAEEYVKRFGRRTV